MADWAELHHDLLFEIGKRLTSIESYESFGAVCRSWRAVATKKHKQQKTFQAPWLMLSREDETDMCKFFNVSSGKTRKIFLPETNKKHCLSWQDWLFIVEDDEIHVSLFHPASRVKIDLPGLNTFPDYTFHSFNNKMYFIERVVLSANPSLGSDFIVMVKWGVCSQLGFCKPGDSSWTIMNNWHCAFTDIIYYNYKLYALDYSNRFIRSDIHGSNPTELKVVYTYPSEAIYKTYLVEFSKKFLLIVRRYVKMEKEEYKTHRFWISKVNIDDDGKWDVLESFGNKALFLGYNSSFFIECSEFNKCKANCIYFSDDHKPLYLLPEAGGKDMGIYHLIDGSIEPLLFDEEIVLCNTKVRPPAWIAPSS